jgi:fatty acid desaturase
VSLARVANIGPRERKRRSRFGLVAFGIGVAAAAALIASGASPRWRLALFMPLFAAALGYFQARAKT